MKILHIVAVIVHATFNGMAWYLPGQIDSDWTIVDSVWEKGICLNSAYKQRTVYKNPVKHHKPRNRFHMHTHASQAHSMCQGKAFACAKNSGICIPGSMLWALGLLQIIYCPSQTRTWGTWEQPGALQCNYNEYFKPWKILKDANFLNCQLNTNLCSFRVSGKFQQTMVVTTQCDGLLNGTRTIGVANRSKKWKMEHKWPIPLYLISMATSYSEDMVGTSNGANSWQTSGWERWPNLMNFARFGRFIELSVD